MRIPCPVCGLRDHSEFRYGSGASADKQRPLPPQDDLAQWCDYVFVPGNPRGVHREYWHHVFGCRQWLIVERDTVTHKIHSAVLARDARRGVTRVTE